MQHRVVCKLLLKVVCGRSVLFNEIFLVSQSLRLTSALVNVFFERGFHVLVQHQIPYQKSVQDTHVRVLLQLGN
jgi:hypothetical protein